MTSNGQPWTVCSSTFHTAHPCSLRSAFNHSPMRPSLGRNAKQRSIIPERGQANWWVVTTTWFHRGNVSRELSVKPWNHFPAQWSALMWKHEGLCIFMLYFLISLWYSLVCTLLFKLNSIYVATVGFHHKVFRFKFSVSTFFYTLSYDHQLSFRLQTVQD